MVTRTIPVGGFPYGVAVDSAAHTAYVANGRSRIVSVIDLVTNKVTHAIPVPNPFDVAVDPAARTLYVTDFGSGTVSVIDLGTSTVIASVHATGAFGVAVDPARHAAYVTSEHFRDPEWCT